MIGVHFRLLPLTDQRHGLESVHDGHEDVEENGSEIPLRRAAECGHAGVPLDDRERAAVQRPPSSAQRAASVRSSSTMRMWTGGPTGNIVIGGDPCDLGELQRYVTTRLPATFANHGAMAAISSTGWLTGFGT